MAKRPRVISEFTNIRVLPSGYQVVVTRAGVEFSRHFAGLSDQSLRAAIRFRDRTLRELPPKRLHEVPRAVLAAVGLTEPMVGIARSPIRSLYQVSYRDKGKIRGKAFSWGKTRSEADAYALAVAFREEVVRGGGILGSKN
jgi:hypothetical protein